MQNELSIMLCRYTRFYETLPKIHKYRIFMEKLNMRTVEIFTFSLLAVSILSYGTTANAVQFEPDINITLVQFLPTADYSLATDRELYSNGQQVVVTGLIPNFADKTEASDVIAQVMQDNTFLTFAQVSPSSDGSFTFSFIAGGPLWKIDGDYHVVAHYEGSKDVVMFSFAGAGTDLVVTDPVDPADAITTPPASIHPSSTHHTHTHTHTHHCQQ